MKASLLWRCRRGLREMDLLLQRFVEQRYETLTDVEKAAFAELLEQTDLDIMDWIMQRTPVPGHFVALITMICTTQETGETANHQPSNKDSLQTE